MIPVIPANTEIRGMTIRDGVCKVDFTEIFSIIRQGRGSRLDQAVVYTLSEFVTVDSVQIMSGGKALRKSEVWNKPC